MFSFAIGGGLARLARNSRVHFHSNRRRCLFGAKSIRQPMKRALIAAIGLASLLPVRMNAQALYAGVRAGAAIPGGSFSDDAARTGNDALLHAATWGPGYGFDAGIGSPLLGFYASYDDIWFNCSSSRCASSGKYRLKGMSAGARVSLPLVPVVKPWAKAGITYNEMTATLNGSSLSTGRRPGYEVGAGVDVPVMLGFFSLAPQVRRIRQKLSLGGSKRPADYYTFDIGLRVRTPL